MKPFDFAKLADALTDTDLDEFAHWRGYSREFCQWLKGQRLFGKFFREGKRCSAFPVQAPTGEIIGAHVRKSTKEGEKAIWFYEPSGNTVQPLIFGDLASAPCLIVGESQWDVFALADRLGVHRGEASFAFCATRGSSNAALAADLAPDASLFATPQHDLQGRRWLRELRQARADVVQLIEVPDAFKDANDWTRSGVSAEEVCRAVVNARALPPLGGSVATWPAPLAPEAYHGLPGEIVRAIEPCSESDPAALLLQTLVAAGNAVGSGPSFVVEDTPHCGRLFACLVGQTSRARKGTAWKRVANLFNKADEPWATRYASGLASGEGLADQVRDATEDKAGVTDKRLMVIESEFGRVLRVCIREGSTLSPTLRAAWDDGNISSLSKNSPVRVTGAHVSLIGHVTRPELRTLLTDNDARNGLANRFLWVCTRRSKHLPLGGNLESAVRNELVTKIHRALGTARKVGRLTMTPAARSLWETEYPRLTADQPGLFGDVTSRAEAQVLRLTIVYALLDGTGAMDVEHLRAGLAVWRYCFESARVIFGDILEDKVAERIRVALDAAGEEGLSRTELHALFDRNERRDRIEKALGDLDRLGLAVARTVKTPGRSSKCWIHTRYEYERNENNEESPP